MWVQKNMSQISMKGLQLTGSLPSCLFAPSSSVTVLDVGKLAVASINVQCI